MKKHKLIAFFTIAIFVTNFIPNVSAVTLTDPVVPNPLHEDKAFTIRWSVNYASNSYRSILQRQINGGSWTSLGSYKYGSGTFEIVDTIYDPASVSYRVKMERLFDGRWYRSKTSNTIDRTVLKKPSYYGPVTPISVVYQNEYQITWSIYDADSNYHRSVLQRSINGEPYQDVMVKEGSGTFFFLDFADKLGTAKYRLLVKYKSSGVWYNYFYSAEKTVMLKGVTYKVWGKDVVFDTDPKVITDDTGSGATRIDNNGMEFNLYVSTFWDLFRSRNGEAHSIIKASFTPQYTGTYLVQHYWTLSGYIFDDDPDVFVKLYFETWIPGFYGSYQEGIGGEGKTIETYNNELKVFGGYSNQLAGGYTYTVYLKIGVIAYGSNPISHTNVIDFSYDTGNIIRRMILNYLTLTLIAL
ncbi:MAG: hypothetical protein D6732_12040 [Methanobacteriota archaeon]|nr:MAG: hypothetical protein D6732_12040 [Euryarchaeota archaeon]